MLRDPEKRAFEHFLIGCRNAPLANAANGQEWSSAVTHDQRLILLPILPAKAVSPASFPQTGQWGSSSPPSRCQRPSDASHPRHHWSLTTVPVPVTPLWLSCFDANNCGKLFPCVVLEFGCDPFCYGSRQLSLPLYTGVTNHGR